MQALNQVVLWDKIVLRGDNPKLLLKDMKTKYFFFDDGNGLKWATLCHFLHAMLREGERKTWCVFKEEHCRLKRKVEREEKCSCSSELKNWVETVLSNLNLKCSVLLASESLSQTRRAWGRCSQEHRVLGCWPWGGTVIPRGLLWGCRRKCQGTWVRKQPLGPGFDTEVPGFGSLNLSEPQLLFVENEGIRMNDLLGLLWLSSLWVSFGKDFREELS